MCARCRNCSAGACHQLDRPLCSSAPSPLVPCLQISNNRLSGPFPALFAITNDSFVNLKVMDFSNNQMTGPVRKPRIQLHPAAAPLLQAASIGCPSGASSIAPDCRMPLPVSPPPLHVDGAACSSLPTSTAWSRCPSSPCTAISSQARQRSRCDANVLLGSLCA